MNYLVSSYLGDSPGDSPGGLHYPGESSGDSRGHYTALDSPGDSPGYLPRSAIPSEQHGDSQCPQGDSQG